MVRLINVSAILADVPDEGGLEIPGTDARVQLNVVPARFEVIR